MRNQLIAELIAAHSLAATRLKTYKEQERKLRDKIVSLVFPSPKSGTNKMSLKELGLEVKAVVKDNWTVKQDGLSEMLAEHDGLQSAFKYKHELVTAGYKALTKDDKMILAEHITCKPGAPELTYEGEMPSANISTLKAKNGLLYIHGQEQSVMVADQVAKFYGFEHAEEIVKFLEEIQ